MTVLQGRDQYYSMFTTEKTEAYKQCAQGPELVIMERALYSQKDSRTLPSHPHLTVK